MQTNVQQQKVVEGLCGWGQEGLKGRMIKAHEGFWGVMDVFIILTVVDSQVTRLSSLDGIGLAEKGIGSQVAGYVHST